MTKLYQKLLKPYFSPDELREGVVHASAPQDIETRAEILRELFSFIDLTTLNTGDSQRSVREFAEKAVSVVDQFPGMKDVAALCVFPNFTGICHEIVGRTNIHLAAVSASFPTSQTFPEVKVMETEMAVRNGADEIDVVMPVGTFLEQDYEGVIDELKIIRKAAGDATLKVILETGLLKSSECVYCASVLAMESGADFIKTSTGKIAVSATPEAAWVMCNAIKDYYDETGIMIGFKPAGGIVTPDDAIIYYNIVRENLGDRWLTPEFFRIGASRLANNILAELYPGRPPLF